MPSSVRRHISSRFTLLMFCDAEVSGGSSKCILCDWSTTAAAVQRGTHATTKSSTSGDINLMRKACRILVGRCTGAINDMLRPVTQERLEEYLNNFS